jgi:hypothetical protein
MNTLFYKRLHVIPASDFVTEKKIALRDSRGYD